MQCIHIRSRRALALTLLLCLLFSACARNVEPNPDLEVPPGELEDLVEVEEEPLYVPGSVFFNALPAPTGPILTRILDNGLRDLASERYAQNSDTVGWLKIDNSGIDDVVLWHPGDNDYYLRRDFYKNYDFLGCYFADFRNTFDGTRSGLSTNTTIYGHNVNDDPNGVMFAQLKKFANEDFARSHPYIYFSTLEEDMAWEIFAVFFTTTELPYNRPNPKGQTFVDIISECLEKSLYTYDGTVYSSDKILTLSTCCYDFTSAYPNNYRFVVMAKLVKPGRELKKEADMIANPDHRGPY